MTKKSSNTAISSSFSAQRLYCFVILKPFNISTYLWILILQCILKKMTECNMTSESIGELHAGGTSAFFVLTFEMFTHRKENSFPRRLCNRKTTLTFLIQISVLSYLSINVQTIRKSLRKTQYECYIFSLIDNQLSLLMARINKVFRRWGWGRESKKKYLVQTLVSLLIFFVNTKFELIQRLNWYWGSMCVFL